MPRLERKSETSQSARRKIKSAATVLNRAALKRLEQSTEQSRAGLGIVLTIKQLRERFGLD